MHNKEVIRLLMEGNRHFFSLTRQRNLAPVWTTELTVHMSLEMSTVLTSWQKHLV